MYINHNISTQDTLQHFKVSKHHPQFKVLILKLQDLTVSGESNTKAEFRLQSILTKMSFSLVKLFEKNNCLVDNQRECT